MMYTHTYINNTMAYKHRILTANNKRGREHGGGRGLSYQQLCLLHLPVCSLLFKSRKFVSNEVKHSRYSVAALLLLLAI